MVSMFVYIDLASAVKSIALSGKGGSWRSWSASVAELVVTKLSFFITFCSSESTHRPSPCRMLPETEVTGRVFHGDLCIFAVM